MCCYPGGDWWPRSDLRKISWISQNGTCSTIHGDVHKDNLIGKWENHEIGFIKKMIHAWMCHYGVMSGPTNMAWKHAQMRASCMDWCCHYGPIRLFKVGFLLDYIWSGLFESKPHHYQKKKNEWNSEMPLGLGQSSAISLKLPRQFVLVQVYV